MSSGTYCYSEILDMPDGQVEWTRSGVWFYTPAVYYTKNGDGSPEESGTEDDAPTNVVWHPDDGMMVRFEDMAPALKTLVLTRIERYMEENHPDPEDGLTDDRERYDG